MPLQFRIKDPYDADQSGMFLDRSFTKDEDGTRVHIFKSKEGWCEWCGHHTEAREFVVEVDQDEHHPKS